MVRSSGLPSRIPNTRSFGLLSIGTRPNFLVAWLACVTRPLVWASRTTDPLHKAAQFARSQFIKHLNRAANAQKSDLQVGHPSLHVDQHFLTLFVFRPKLCPSFLKLLSQVLLLSLPRDPTRSIPHTPTGSSHTFGATDEYHYVSIVLVLFPNSQHHRTLFFILFLAGWDSKAM